jgi:phosphatidylethanolamine/phosphatidyl-N-methylethanolamine N-methyltransferase
VQRDPQGSSSDRANGGATGGPVIDHASVRKTYRWYAPLYDLVFGAVLDGGRRALARAVAKAGPARVLEIGVGTGLLLSRYPADAQLVGVDLSPEMLRQAQRSLERNGLGDRVDLLLTDAEQLPFGDASFDCVTLPYVITVTPDPARLLREAERVCTASGQILILSHFKGGAWGWAERLLAPLAARIGFRSTMTLEEAVQDAGWRVADASSVNLLGLSKLVRLVGPGQDR